MMKSYDYIVVGAGLAGIAFCEQLRKANKSFLVFDNSSQQSSRVAAGLYNPVILKRFTKVWKAKFLLDLAMPKYQELEQLLQIKLNHQIPVYRKFTSIEEQNDWLIASDKLELCEFMSPNFIKNTNSTINADFGFGEVLQTGRIDSNKLVNAYHEFLQEQQLLHSDKFQYDILKTESQNVIYQNINARHIVFAEGYGIHANPYFQYLPLNGTKGEMLTIKAPDLHMKFILKSSVFIVPLGNALYWVGATYEWKDKTHNVTEDGKNQLTEKLKQIIRCDFKVIDQVAGIRPTTKDRRPLVGTHDDFKNVHVLNGLGTRGVMMSHFVAEQLFDHIENGKLLDPEIDIKRFAE